VDFEVSMVSSQTQIRSHTSLVKIMIKYLYLLPFAERPSPLARWQSVSALHFRRASNVPVCNMRNALWYLGNDLISEGKGSDVEPSPSSIPISIPHMSWQWCEIIRRKKACMGSIQRLQIGSRYGSLRNTK
jgi:hypothetical protein